MAWKPKEPELTLEQAVELATKELASFWHGSKPLLAGVRNGNAVQAFPLDLTFNERTWMLFFVDPTRSSGEVGLFYAREWHRRFAEHKIGVIIIFRPAFGFLRETRAIEQLMRREHFDYPLVVDAEGMLSAAFGVHELPKFVLFSKGKAILDRSGPEWTKGAESAIQTFLRASDPGLSLHPVIDLDDPNRPEWKRFKAREAGQMDFGAGRGIKYPAPGFGGPAGGFRAGAFKGERPAKLEPGQLFIRGKWLQDGDRIATADPDAQIGFRSPSSNIILVAQSLSKTGEPGKIIVEINDTPAYDACAGGDMVFDDEGHSVVRVEHGKQYEVLRGVPEKDREVTLSFPFADRASVALYGLRFTN